MCAPSGIKLKFGLKSVVWVMQLETADLFEQLYHFPQTHVITSENVEYKNRAVDIQILMIGLVFFLNLRFGTVNSSF